MHRLQVIAEDLRPLLQDRKDSLTSSGARLWDLIDEIEAIGKKIDKPSLIGKFLGAKNDETVPTETLAGSEYTDLGTNEQQNAGPTEEAGEAAPRAAASRKSNAAQRHAEAIARGEIGKGD